jgi:hypothetical protein
MNKNPEGQYPLDRIIKEKLVKEIDDTSEEMISGADHLKRLKSYLKKRINELENLQIMLADQDVVKHEAYEARQSIQELLQRLYLAHQDQKFTEEQFIELDNRLHKLTQQFPQYFNIPHNPENN